MRVEKAPVVLLTIAGRRLSREVTDRILSFTYEDTERAMDVLEVTLADLYLELVDHPLLQEGREIRVRFGYAGQLSPTKVGVIKEIGYDFPESGAPTITLKAYDKGCMLASEQVQRVWERPGGIRASDIATAIATEHGLTPVVTATVDRFPRLHQSKQSDAQWLAHLAKTARAVDGKGATGYVFYIEGEELHFHTRGLEKSPVMALEYFTDREGILHSFRPSTRTQGDAAGGKSATAVGVSPATKAATTTSADNASTPDRPVLGRKTTQGDGASAGSGRVVIDANTGKRITGLSSVALGEGGRTATSVPGGQRAGRITPTTGGAPQRPAAEERFVQGELGQVTAEAVTVGLPTLRAKTNVEIRGVGQKFSGLYHVETVRHRIDGSGYSCELTLRRNALGDGAGRTAPDTLGKRNAQHAPTAASAPTSPPTRAATPSRQVVIDANTGRRR